MTLLRKYIEQYKPLIDQGIEKELAKRLAEVGDISQELVTQIEAMQELSLGGKRMRGLLTILGYEIGTQYTVRSTQYNDNHDNEVLSTKNSVPIDIVKAAVVMELFHLGLLIQDDVMDRDSLRRSVATIHTRYGDPHLGESMAILAGDYTYGWGMEMLSEHSTVISDQNRLAAMKIWGKYFARVGYGQALDVMKIADEDSILQVLNLKSGEYSCVLPLLLGATLSGGSRELLDQLTKYGMELGWVFQLRDDYLAEYGESAKTGKPVGNDSREGKRTLATMYGKERVEEEVAKHEQGAVASAMGNKYLEELASWAATREN